MEWTGLAKHGLSQRFVKHGLTQAGICIKTWINFDSSSAVYLQSVLRYLSQWQIGRERK
jgi:hypothetical protein